MKDISQIIPDAAAFDRDVIAGLRRAVSHTVTVTTMKARNEHAWQDRTFDTRESIEGDALSWSGTGGKGTVSAGLNAKRLNDGTKPHPIVAVNAHYLRFKVGGTVMFRRSVQHPGTTGDHFLDAAADAAGEELALSVEQALDEAFGG